MSNENLIAICMHIYVTNKEDVLIFTGVHPIKGGWNGLMTWQFVSNIAVLLMLLHPALTIPYYY